MIITIDGSSGVGKSAVAHGLAHKINGIQVSMGLFFRAFSWCKQNGKEYQSPLLKFKPGNGEEYPGVFWDDQDITEQLYGNCDLDKIVSDLGGNLIIQEYAYKQALSYDSKHVVMEGRNTCEYVAGENIRNIFLIASFEEKQRRNSAFLNKNGLKSVKQLQEVAKLRDLEDSKRKIGTLKIHNSHSLLNTDGNDLQQTVEQIMDFITLKQQKVFFVVNEKTESLMQLKCRQFNQIEHDRCFDTIAIHNLLATGLADLKVCSLLFFILEDDIPTLRQIKEQLFLHEHNLGCMVQRSNNWSISGYLYARMADKGENQACFNTDLIKTKMKKNRFRIISLDAKMNMTEKDLLFLAFQDYFEQDIMVIKDSEKGEGK